jgi:hypothetical protein
MTEHTVGLRLGKRSEVLTIEAEDALIAALKVKLNHRCNGHGRPRIIGLALPSFKPFYRPDNVVLLS